MASRPITPLVFLEDASAAGSPAHPAHSQGAPSFSDYVAEHTPKPKHEFTEEQMTHRRVSKGQEAPTLPEVDADAAAAELADEDLLKSYPQDDVPDV